ncbi:MAG: FecR domain-containing protein [Verrucomicrobiae bacterium]|nr:FecR domain-containing protein [Verrucomicrobiae bacterium]NNJ43865.1 hypothetical protein [Akkermansiaceae bacterium]
MIRDKLKLHIQALLDGCITDADLSSLETELEQSEEARKLYLDYTEIHSLMEQKASGASAAYNVVSIDRIISKQKRIRIAVFAAAAVLIIGLVSLRLLTVQEGPPALVFNTAAGSEFTLTHDPGDSETEGMIMDKGSRLQLSRGTVELTFASGVRSVIKAPADMTLQEDDTLFLNRGAAWFDVPEKAIGFTVKTKDLNVVDLGTEFGVVSKPGAYGEVHVFNGKVKASALNIRKESVILVANEARRNNPTGRLDTIAVNPSAFLKNLAELPPYLHWAFDEYDQFDVKGSHPAVDEVVTTPISRQAPPELVQGKSGAALLLNGNSQGLQTNWAGIYGDDRPLSTAVWVRIPKGADLTDWPAIVGWGIPMYSKAKWKVQATHPQNDIGNPPVARVSLGGHFYDSQTRLDDNQWHHIAAVYHGTHPETGEPDMALYVDGQRESLTHYTAPLRHEGLDVDEYEEIKNSPDARPMMIGQSLRKSLGKQDTTFRGLIDELYIFDGALSQEAIKTLVTFTNNPQPTE